MLSEVFELVNSSVIIISLVLGFITFLTVAIHKAMKKENYTKVERLLFFVCNLYLWWGLFCGFCVWLIPLTKKEMESDQQKNCNSDNLGLVDQFMDDMKYGFYEDWFFALLVHILVFIMGATLLVPILAVMAVLYIPITALKLAVRILSK